MLASHKGQTAFVRVIIGGCLLISLLSSEPTFCMNYMKMDDIIKLQGLTLQDIYFLILKKEK